MRPPESAPARVNGPGEEVPEAVGRTDAQILARPLSFLQPAALDINGVAALLGVSRGLIETMNAAGEIPRALRLHRRRLWSRVEIENWIAAGAPSRVRWEAMKGGAK